MVASLEMRAIRELPLAASLALAAAAVFFGGGPGYGSLPWLGGGALLAILAALGLRGAPAGALRLLPLALLAGWLALSISWSTLPDRSWDYANRALVYLLFAALGLWLADRRRALALGLASLLGALIVWSLLGKVLPFLYDYGPPGVGRLRGPVGLWNQLALLADVAVVLALWRRRLEGALLAYVALAALLLTYSRGGLITAVLLVAAWFALDRERVEAARTLLAGALPAAAVVGIAFALPGVTGDGQSAHARWRDGLIFGGLLAAGAVATILLRRVPLPQVSRRVVLSAVAAVVLGLVVVVVVKGGGSGTVGNGGGRLANTSSNFRFVWWHQALDGWQHHRLAGTGAGTFQLTNLLYRTTYLDATIEPHSLPLQFLTEAGIVGLLLFVLAFAVLLRPAWRRPHGHELALALVLPAYLLHGLVDVDWDFAAVSAPVFLVAGALVGGAPRARGSSFGLVAGAGAAVLVFGVLLLPWLGERWAGDALGASPPARAVQLANRAHSVDPLLVEPYWAKAGAATQPRVAFAYYVEAVHRQPANPATWLAAGEYAFGIGCYQSAYTYLERYTELDQKARRSEGGDDYNTALGRVNAGKGVC
jgi:O-Antigen ligase